VSHFHFQYELTNDLLLETLHLIKPDVIL